jgi:hypothetical protein
MSNASQVVPLDTVLTVLGNKTRDERERSYNEEGSARVREHLAACVATQNAAQQIWADAVHPTRDDYNDEQNEAAQAEWQQIYMDYFS